MRCILFIHSFIHVRVVQPADKAGELGASEMLVEDLGRDRLGVDGKGVAVWKPPKRILGYLIVQQLHQQPWKRVGRDINTRMQHRG
jgi:hypothetical protein